MVERHDLAQEIESRAKSRLFDMREDKLNRAQTFRSRANQLRAIADTLVRQAERELLIQLATEYDEMARSAAAIARTVVAGATAPKHVRRRINE
jgi:hypothetical protein